MLSDGCGKSENCFGVYEKFVGTIFRIVESKEQLRGYEGEAASIYFGVFDELIFSRKRIFTSRGEINDHHWIM